MRFAPTHQLSTRTLAMIRRLVEEAYGHPFVEDWGHALGGMHVFVEEDGEPVSHASVVERTLETGGIRMRTGYVEAVATRPDRRRAGLASRVMRAVTDYVRGEFEIGGLCTGENAFFARFGWETWRGPTFVRTGEDRARTADEDGNVMILRTPRTPAVDLDGPISCEWRAGDVW